VPSVGRIIENNFTSITDEYKAFVEAKDKCRACSVYSHYGQVLQSEGNAKNPVFMFIGEAPGRDEVSQVRPFVGRAGQRLREELRKHGDIFNPQTTLISNVIACRPLDNKFPSDRNDEFRLYEDGEWTKVKAKQMVAFCFEHWVCKEIEMVKPKIIITLGGQALKWIRNSSIGVTSARGSLEYSQRFNAWVFSTFHPSYVIRCEKMSNVEVVKLFEHDIKYLAKEWQSITAKSAPSNGGFLKESNGNGEVVETATSWDPIPILDKFFGIETEKESKDD